MNACHLLAVVGILLLPVASPAAPADSLHASPAAGLYPAAPSERHNPLPTRVGSLRNLALRRQTTASSQYDYNLTPQLITDGIRATAPLPWLTVTTPEGALPARERERLLDGRDYTRITLRGDSTFCTLLWRGMDVSVNAVRFTCRMVYDAAKLQKGWRVRLLVSRDGRTWETADEHSGTGLPGQDIGYTQESDPNKAGPAVSMPVREIDETLRLQAGRYKGLRIELSQKGAVRWDAEDLNITTASGALTELLPSSRFVSGWRSADGGEQWVETDLGDTARIEKVSIQWLTGLKRGMLLSSADGRTWTDSLPLSAAAAGVADYRYRAVARYLRLRLSEPDSTGYYAIGEMEAWGRGGIVYTPRPAQQMRGRRLSLCDASWRMMRASQVTAAGEKLSLPTFKPESWAAATVPATILTSHVNIGAVSPPLHAANITNASESYFNGPFWYRGLFTMPRLRERRHIFLHLDGINRDAVVYLNGRRVTEVHGAFMRGRAEITSLIQAGENVIAIRVSGGQHPGIVKQKTLASPDINGGDTGADAPSFQATVGWDWIPTMRGRATGIYDDVYITLDGAFSLSDPMVTTTLAKGDTAASMTPRVVVTNNENTPQSGRIEGTIGALSFATDISLAPHESREVSFSPHDYAVLLNRRMKLWWPNGYGTPYLYNASFCMGGDTIRYKAGIREIKAREVLKDLKLYCNGVRITPRGGSWGFSEASLSYGRREYADAVAYHRDMGLNMIRNWVGQTAARAFYDAADSLGIMIWQDFWLANPVDGPDPADARLFTTVARDYIMRIRSHPSLAIYCGRNEGYPPLDIDAALREYVRTIGGDLPYISSSADDGTGGHGPYQYKGAEYYFAHCPERLHSEMGMPAIMTIESMRRTFSPAGLWPQGDEWGIHDFTLSGAQGGAGFNAALTRLFGPAHSAAEYAAFSQWLCRDGYRAMMEGCSLRRRGMLLWMSHPAWPSLTWQTYDYYMEPLGAYFGTKAASEPLHIQYDAFRRTAEVVNILPRDFGTLLVSASVYDDSGRNLSADTYDVKCGPDTTIQGRQITPPDDYSGAYFVSLSLKDRSGRELSQSLYTVPDINGSYSRLLALPKPQLQKDVKINSNTATVRLRNTGSTPALSIRLKLIAADGNEILPVIYSDNYFHLLPSQEKTVSVRWDKADARGAASIMVSDISDREK